MGKIQPTLVLGRRWWQKSCKLWVVYCLTLWLLWLVPTLSMKSWEWFFRSVYLQSFNDPQFLLTNMQTCDVPFPDKLMAGHSLYISFNHYFTVRHPQHAHMHVHLLINTLTHRHTDTQTQRDTQPHRHTDTQTHRHTHIDTHPHSYHTHSYYTRVITHT